MSAIRTRVLGGFDDPAFGPEQWEALLGGRSTDAVYLTSQWQRSWWETFGEGELLLIAAERDDRVVALAPLYADSGMIYFVGTGFESGHLDFIGDIDAPGVLEAILATARDRARDFLGFQLYFVPAGSSTEKRLAEAAAVLDLSCHEEGDIALPVIDLAGRPEKACAATRKDDALSRERRIRRGGPLEAHHLRDGHTIVPQLETFFEQHIARWAVTPHPSRFLHAKQRAFIGRLTREAAETGWLRFVRLDWDGRPIAFQYGFCYRGRYVREISTFAIDLAHHSPGQVLLRASLLAAIGEGARIFDFGIGDQAYKRRFATDVGSVRTWGLYPNDSSAGPRARSREER